MPEISQTGGRDLQTYALAYAERYQGDVLQLEHEWEFLYAALIQARQRSEYGIVVRLVCSLAYPAGRISDPGVPEQILRFGIEAARWTEDREHLGSFLNRLGCLLFACGNYNEGRRLWRASLELTGALGSSLVPWEPLSSFAHIADILDDYSPAQLFVERVMHTRLGEDADCLAAAVFIRGFYARLENNLDQAHRDLSYSLRLLSSQPPGAAPSAYRQLFSMTVQSELARVQGDYARSQDYAATALSLAHIFGDRYTLLDLLIDQAHFTERHAQFEDTQATILRLRDVSRESNDPHHYEKYRLLEQQLAGRLQLDRTNEEQPSSARASTRPQEPLSKREIEVLQLVAAGRTSREIAGCLFVTPGTVKKHLEHVYDKLNVHSRTSALARARELEILP